MTTAASCDKALLFRAPHVVTPALCERNTRPNLPPPPPASAWRFLPSEMICSASESRVRIFSCSARKKHCTGCTVAKSRVFDVRLTCAKCVLPTVCQPHRQPPPPPGINKSP